MLKNEQKESNATVVIIAWIFLSLRIRQISLKSANIEDTHRLLTRSEILVFFLQFIILGKNSFRSKKLELVRFCSDPFWIYHSRNGDPKSLPWFQNKKYIIFLSSSHIAVLKFIRGVCPSPRQQRIRIPNEPIMNMLSSYWTCWQKTIFQTSFASIRPFGTSVDGRKFDRQRTKTVHI